MNPLKSAINLNKMSGWGWGWSVSSPSNAALVPTKCCGAVSAVRGSRRLPRTNLTRFSTSASDIIRVITIKLNRIIIIIITSH